MAAESRRTTPAVETRVAVSSDRAVVAAKPALVQAAPPQSGHKLTVAEQLFQEGYSFDFFQAVKLLGRLHTDRRPVGRLGPPNLEIVRFKAHLSLSFPPSVIYDIERPSAALSGPAMTVTFMGLTGPNGILPHHYTELLMRLQREARGPEKGATRAWFDIFNHRLISLFYRAWEKYRFAEAYERGDYAKEQPDPFHHVLFSFVGLGMPTLRNRLQVVVPGPEEDESKTKVLARIEDLALLHYSGFLAQRPRSAVILQALLQDYFNMPVQICQFQGQWLLLDESNQSRLDGDGNNSLGVNLVAGERVWDIQSKVRLRMGPMSFDQFNEFLPDRSPQPQRKAFFLLAHLARLYLGPELDFEIQLVLRAADVPGCQLGGAEGARLGWNSWIATEAAQQDADDPVFAGEEVFTL
jgi:type VI secretion system protein ImpH